MLELYLIKTATSSVNYSRGPQAIKQFIDLVPAHLLSIVIIPPLFIFIHLQTSSVDSNLAVINDPSTIGSNFDFENFSREKDERSC